MMTPAKAKANPRKYPYGKPWPKKDRDYADECLRLQAEWEAR